MFAVGPWPTPRLSECKTEEVQQRALAVGKPELVCAKRCWSSATEAEDLVQQLGLCFEIIDISKDHALGTK